MAKIAASHAQGKVSSDMAFELNARAITAASQFGNDKVINGTVGSILDEAGRLVLLPTVEKIFRDLSSSDIAAYATIAGLPGYLKAAEDLTFRKSRPDAYVSTLATAGGTGVIHHAVWNYSEVGDTILTSDWYWGAYKSLAEDALRKFDTFTFYDEHKNFNISAFSKKVEEVLGRQDSLLLIINSPGHNPTGYSLTDAEWGEVLEVLKGYAEKGKRIALLADIAYIDYSGDEDACRSFITQFGQLPANLIVMFAFSMSKSFTLYGQRTGAIIGVSSDKEAIDEFTNAMEITCRSTWSNVNRAAMRTLEIMHNDQALFNAVETERKIYKDLIEQRSHIFVDEAAEVGLEILPYRGGFFVSIPTDHAMKATEYLMEKQIYTLPLPKGVRVATCAVSSKQMPGLAKMVKEAIELSK